MTAVFTLVHRGRAWRLPTAEIRRLAGDGADVVGMTGMPEAVLARELGIPYAQLNVVANYAAGIGESANGIEFSALGPVLEEAMCKVRRIIETLVGCKHRVNRLGNLDFQLFQRSGRFRAVGDRTALRQGTTGNQKGIFDPFAQGARCAPCVMQRRVALRFQQWHTASRCDRQHGSIERIAGRSRLVQASRPV